MFKYGVAASVLLLATTAGAAEGDLVSTYASGEYYVVEYLLCDGDYVDASPPNSCATLDLHAGTGATVTTTPWRGLPLFIVVEVRTDNGAAKNIGFAEGRSAVAGQRHNLHATGLRLGTTTTSVTLEPLSHRFISYEVTTEGDGTDMEVLVRMFYQRVR